MYDVIVIGAGMAGTLTALKLAKRNLKVLFLELGREVLPVTSTSYNECYKLHTGVHFIGDRDTAIKCLLSSIEFAREFPDFLAGEKLSDPWRRGRHFVMSNSLVPLKSAKAVISNLLATYANLVEADEGNKVFGEVEDFIKYLKPEDYPYIASEIPFFDAQGKQSKVKVALGIETGESQIDFPRLKAHLQQQIQMNPNITFKPLHEAIRIKRNPSAFAYDVTVKNARGEEECFTSESVVNCSWQNIEKLDRTLGVYKSDDNRVMRVKVSILVALPKELQKINTCTFSAGPYASITVLPDGTAVLTSERYTNFGYFKSGEDMPEELKKAISNLKLDRQEGQEIARHILQDCASYFDKKQRDLFLQTEIKELRIGYVKMIGMPNVYTPQAIWQVNSCIHSREADGVEVREPGYIANSAMKMTYAAKNAMIIADDLLPNHFVQMGKMQELVEGAKARLFDKNPQLKEHGKAIDEHLYCDIRPKLVNIVSSNDFSKDPSRCIRLLTDQIAKDEKFAPIDSMEASITRSPMWRYRFFNDELNPEMKPPQRCRSAPTIITQRSKISANG